MPTAAEPPGRVEASALAIAGPAFAASLLFLRDATPVGAGAFDGAAIVLVALGAAPWIHRWQGPAWATLARGVGLAVGALLAASAVVAPFDKAAAPAALAILGCAVLQANARRGASHNALDALGLAILSVALGIGIAGAAAFPEPSRLRATLVAVGAAMVVGLALRRLLLARRNTAWLAPMPLGILIVSALGASYVSYRGLVGAHVTNLPLYEWTFAAAVATLLLARLRRKAREREAPDAWSGDARRHAQDVRPVYDDRMGPLAAAVGRYLDHGVGYEEYRAALTRVPGIRVPNPVAQGRGRAAKRAAHDARLAAHAAALTAPRGSIHGDPDAARA